MQNLMPPIDTTDHAFHDGDPTTGQLGTIVTAAWLNGVQGATRDIQAEIIAVLTKAGIQPNPQKQNQLAEAISQIIGSGGYATRGDLTLGLSKKIDKADITQQLGNDTGKVVSQNLLATELGKKAGVADVNNKLDKSKVTNSLINSRELVPTTALLIDNLALKQPAGDYQEAGYSYSKTESDSKYQLKGDYALKSDLNGLIKPGFTMQTMLDEADIAPPWYVINGDRYGIETYQGQVLRAFSDDFKARWNIIQTDETITLPRVLQSDGRMPFLRPVNGTGRETGSVSGDTIRNFTGEIGYSGSHGLASGERDVNGVFRTTGASKRAFAGGGAGLTRNIIFDPSAVVPTGTENKPLDVGVTWIIYLGV